MQKKILAVVACMIAIAVIVGIVVTTRNTEKAQQIEQILQEDSEEETTALVSLEEVRREADAVIEAGRNGEYRNLQFNKFNPLITEEDQIYRIKVTAPDVSVTEENLQKVIDAMQIFLEKPIDETLIIVAMPNELDRISVAELRKGIQEQKQEYIGRGYYLFYLDEEEDLCAQINSYMNSLWIDRGLKGVVPSGEDRLDKIYYPCATDESLQDVYETADGEMSVEEAIIQVENYFNHEFTIPILDNVEYKVARVYILKMPDGTYGFDCAIRRSYGGVPFESANEGTRLEEEDDTHELSEAVLDKENHVLFFNGVACNNNVEELQEISEIVPLERAVEYISQKIGDNTVYTVKQIELAYMGKYKMTEDGSEYETWTPKWIFYTTNETTGRDVRFYVDVVTGDVETRKIND